MAPRRADSLRAEDLNGYGARIGGENVELLKMLNERLQRLDQELAGRAAEDAQTKRLMTIVG